MASFYSDGLQFNYATRGLGANTFFFQHGIGGTLAQPFRFLLRSDGEDSNFDKEPGGISMGAAVGLSAALRYPERCIALVLSRPAWLNGSMSSQAIAAYAEAVRFLKDEPSPESALQKLEKSDIYRAINEQCADAGKSLLGQVRCVVLDPN